MPVDKEDKPRLSGEVFENLLLDDDTCKWTYGSHIYCSSKSQAPKFSKAIKAMAEGGGVPKGDWINGAADDELKKAKELGLLN